MTRMFVLALLTAIGPVASLAACEGEPPVNSPENPSGTGSAVAVTSAAPTETTPPAEATACPPPPCAPGPAPVASAAPPAGASAAPETSGPVPPVNVPRGNITGAVTTKPVTLVGQAVVYLEDAPKEDVPARLQAVSIDNKQMNFIPFVSVVTVGGKVNFVNSDPFPHNVFSPDNEKFNMGNLPQNGVHQRTFKNPGAYSLLCNLHPGMLGYLLVSPTSYYAHTDAKGKFVVKHIPVGTYKVSAWAPRQAVTTQSVTVTEGDVTANFDLHR